MKNARILVVVTGLCAATAVVVAACGSSSDHSFDADGGPTGGADGAVTPGSEGSTTPVGEGGATGDPGVGYPDGGCSPLTCKSGCCSAAGQCLPGTAPDQCGKGGLTCVACNAMGYGCVDQGCNAAATCPNCDGCCQAGTCNPNGKTRDDACGANGAICKDCTQSGQSCNGMGFCQ